MARSEPAYLVAGAGITGLSAAMTLAERSAPVLLVESRPFPGGLAAARKHGTLICHPGLHLLHPSTDALRGVVQRMVQLMGDDVCVVRPDSGLHFLGTTLDFPFKTRQFASVLGPLSLMRIVTDAGLAHLRNSLNRSTSQSHEDSFQDVVSRAYGEEFYRLFFHDYTQKVLGLHPSDISGEWARRRVPMPTGRALLQTLFPWWRPKRVEHPFPSFPVGQFTGRRGMEPLFEGMLTRSGDACEFLSRTSMRQVHLSNHRVLAVTLEDSNGHPNTLPVKGLVSTIPVTELLPMLSPLPPQPVLEAGRRLRFRGMVMVYIEVKRSRLSEKHWTYYQSDDFVFNRLSEFGNVVPGAYGERRTVVTAEVTADAGEAFWEADDRSCIEAALRDLRKADSTLTPEDIGQCSVEREVFAYPNYTLGFQKDRRLVLDWLDQLEGLTTLGRQGRFSYLNMDECFAQGMRAQTLLESVFEGATR